MARVSTPQSTKATIRQLKPNELWTGLTKPALKTAEPIYKIPEYPLEILNFKLFLEENGNQPDYIYSTIQKLTRLSKQCDIMQPERVKQKIAQQQTKNSVKNLTANIYTAFLNYKQLKWTKPHYQTEETIPYIPPEKDIDTLIAGTSKLISTLIQLLKETAIRTEEATKAEWNDIDEERKLISIRPAKGSNPRILPISQNLIGKLQQLPHKTKIIFNKNKRSIRSNFYRQRNTLAKNQNNPKLNLIHLHTLRHWKATIEYHKLQNIYKIKQLLGHKSVKSTEIYITIESMIYIPQNSEYESATAQTVQEAQKLIEAGFEYQNHINDIAIYRKRK